MKKLAALMMMAALLLGEQIGIFLIETDCALKYVDDEASRHGRDGGRAASGKMI